MASESLDQPEVEYDFRRPLMVYDKSFDCFYIIGGKRNGKTTLLEWQAEHFEKHNYLIIDLTDAGDFESAYWGIRDCRLCHGPVRYDQDVCPVCKIKPKDAYKVLLMVPDYGECTIGDPNYKLFPVSEGDKYAFKNAVQMAINEKRILSLASGLFETDHLYKSLTEWFYQWIQLNRDVFRKNTCIILREAADVAFSRGKSQETSYEKRLKSSLINLIRKGGHCRTVILFDSQRYMGLDIGVRGNIPKILVKKHSHHDMPKVVENLNKQIKSQRWVWFMGEKGKKRVPVDLINMKRPEITHLHKNEFYVLFDNGEYELLKNGFPSFHHKGEYDYFDNLTDLQFSQELFSLDDEKKKSIKKVPKAVLLPVVWKLYDTWGLEEKELAKLFERGVTTIKSWIKEAEG